MLLAALLQGPAAQALALEVTSGLKVRLCSVFCVTPAALATPLTAWQAAIGASTN